ncbi:MAG: hypothetical protein HY331_11670 [Chloroflexi bacterium]|nr:hypothetical protein [Chloroflexota bacterium]
MASNRVVGELPARFALGQVLVWGGAVALQPAFPQMGEVAVAPGSLPSLAKALEAVPEHRRPRGFKAHQPPYPLIPLLLLGRLPLKDRVVSPPMTPRPAPC